MARLGVPNLEDGILPCSRGPEPQHRAPRPPSGRPNHNRRVTPTHKTGGGYRLVTMVSSFHHAVDNPTLTTVGCIGARRSGTRLSSDRRRASREREVVPGGIEPPLPT